MCCAMQTRFANWLVLFFVLTVSACGGGGSSGVSTVTGSEAIGQGSNNNSASLDNMQVDPPLTDGQQSTETDDTDAGVNVQTGGIADTFCGAPTLYADIGIEQSFPGISQFNESNSGFFFVARSFISITAEDRINGDRTDIYHHNAADGRIDNLTTALELNSPSILLVSNDTVYFSDFSIGIAQYSLETGSLDIISDTLTASSLTQFQSNLYMGGHNQESGSGLYKYDSNLNSVEKVVELLGPNGSPTSADSVYEYDGIIYFFSADWEPPNPSSSSLYSLDVASQSLSKVAEPTAGENYFRTLRNTSYSPEAVGGKTAAQLFDVDTDSFNLQANLMVYDPETTITHTYIVEDLINQPGSFNSILGATGNIFFVSLSIACDDCVDSSPKALALLDISTGSLEILETGSNGSPAVLFDNKFYFVQEFDSGAKKQVSVLDLNNRSIKQLTNLSSSSVNTFSGPIGGSFGSRSISADADMLYFNYSDRTGESLWAMERCQ